MNSVTYVSLNVHTLMTLILHTRCISVPWCAHEVLTSLVWNMLYNTDIDRNLWTYTVSNDFSDAPTLYCHTIKCLYKCVMDLSFLYYIYRDCITWTILQLSYKITQSSFTHPHGIFCLEKNEAELKCFILMFMLLLHNLLFYIFFIYHCSIYYNFELTFLF